MSYATDRWWTPDTVAVVTGANKGIGYAIAKLLAQQGVTTVVTARQEDQGKKAAAEVQQAAPSSKVLFHTLDISDPASVDRFAQWLKSECGGLTILVNNAGFAYKGNAFGADEAQATLDINFFGTANLTEKLVPLLKDNARIVNVSSTAGLRSIIRSPELLKELESARTLDELKALANRFVDDIRSGQHSAKGWPNSMYGMSKLLVTLYTLQLAERLRGQQVMVNALCPGYVKTDMSSQRGHKSPEEGADTPVFLALRSPQDFVTGQFWRDRSPQSF